MGFLELLTIVFIVLKLTANISWSWFWVLCPLYPAILLYLIIIFVFGGAVFCVWRGDKKK